MLRFNIHDDQDVAKSYNFKGDAKYPAESSNFYEDKKRETKVRTKSKEDEFNGA